MANKWASGRETIDALIATGIADLETIRAVIDIDATGIVKVYLEKVGNTRIIEVVQTLEGTKVQFIDMETNNAVEQPPE